MSSDDDRVPTLREPRYSQSLQRGLAILTCFTPERPILGIADVADELGMSRATTHRYMVTLVALGYLEQSTSRKYRLGLRVTDLGMSALNCTGLRQHAREYLEDLRARTRFTTSLAILDRDVVICIDRLPGYRRNQHDIEFYTAIGTRRPAHTTAMGKMLLASLPDHEQRDLLSRLTLTKNTGYTITSRTVLGTELQTIRERGLATSDQELFRDHVAIAAPVRNETHEVVAAVGLSANRKTTSLAELVDGPGPQVVATADKVSGRLGFDISASE